MKMYANLHTHSTHSDGVYTPEELVKIAKDEGYGALAITDHDAATAYPYLKAACDAAGLETIFGTEFTGYSPEHNFTFHITAYGYDPEYPEMADYLAKCAATTANQTRILFERGIENGFIQKGLTWEEIEAENPGVKWFCNDHVFRAMKKRGMATELDYPAFFDNVYGKHRREVPELYKRLDLRPIIDLITRAGGIAFVAHPYGKLHLIPELIKDGICGLEVWHAMLNDDERKQALTIAKDYNLYISGGSDHEGLCGGQYQFYEDYKSTQFYVPELSTGTTKEFFDEIVNRKLMSNREEYINEIIKEYV